MAEKIVEAVEAFLALNTRFCLCGLEERDHVLWSSLAQRVESALVTDQAEGLADGPRRQHVRARVQLGLRFVQPGDIEDTYTLDVSRGGCSVELPRPLTRGTEVEVKLYLPEQLGAVVAAGWVCWCGPSPAAGKWRVGMTFAGLSPRDRDLIAAFVLGETAPHLWM